MMSLTASRREAGRQVRSLTLWYLFGNAAAEARAEPVQMLPDRNALRGKRLPGGAARFSPIRDAPLHDHGSQGGPTIRKKPISFNEPAPTRHAVEAVPAKPENRVFRVPKGPKTRTSQTKQ